MRFSVLRALISRIAVVGGAALLLTAPPAAHAQSFSFSSTDPGFHPFVNDNDVQLIGFTINDPSDLLTISTGSYADMTLNGFPTALALFTSTGNAATDALIGESINDNGLNDAKLSAVVPAGSYLIALTQHDNAALGPNRSDGYAFNNATFSDPLYTGGPFIDFNGTQRTGNWQVTANATPVPELGTGLLFIPGGLFLAGSLLARRRTLKGETNG